MDVTDLTRRAQELTRRVELLTRQRDEARARVAELEAECDATRDVFVASEKIRVGQAVVIRPDGTAAPATGGEP